jgi:hypothetical protein
MEDLFERYLLALAYIASFDPYPGCDLEDAETIKKVLSDQPATKKKIEDLLFEKPPEKKYEIELSKTDMSTLPSIDTMLFHESNSLQGFDFLKEMPESKRKELPTFSTTPTIQTPMEEILTKININDLKIKYVRAQNQLLHLYIQEALKKLRSPSEEANSTLFTKLLNIYPNLLEPIGDLDTIEGFLKEAPCSLHEIEFLRSILRDHELRNKKL